MSPNNLNMFPKGASHLNHTCASPMPEFSALYSLGMEGTFEPSKIRAKIRKLKEKRSVHLHQIVNVRGEKKTNVHHSPKYV